MVNNMKIKVISSSWTNSKDYTPKEEESFYEIQLNKKYVVKAREYSNVNGDTHSEEIFSFEVSQISDNSVSIHTFQPFSDKEQGINLRSNKQDFTIDTDKPVRLITPTMDRGDIFTLSLVD